MISRNYINNMGVIPMSDLEKKTLEVFMKNNPGVCLNLTEKEIYSAFKNSTVFAFTRLSIAFSPMVEDFKKATKHLEVTFVEKDIKKSSYLKDLFSKMLFDMRGLLK